MVRAATLLRLRFGPIRLCFRKSLEHKPVPTSPSHFDLRVPHISSPPLSLPDSVYCGDRLAPGSSRLWENFLPAQLLFGQRRLPPGIGEQSKKSSSWSSERFVTKDRVFRPC